MLWVKRSEASSELLRNAQDDRNTLFVGRVGAGLDNLSLALKDLGSPASIATAKVVKAFIS